ncbi:thioesterase family protein [Sinorhizobium garamanticum]|uniref:Thioesterase family protein n=1 Tax=Sinorhizobium garamanticum TaxID=680247 RepID=A0ABY8D547_9HYPH|nr:thioesterase family protein [Sinorhizobium garamanticum]WEX85986.1 thioesterase family protein [Sinorhizobium garamanticum]
MSDTRELPILAAGLRHSERLAVTPFHTVPEVDDAWPGFRDMPPVFATAMMIGFIEQTCIEALRPYLTDEQRTVGTHVDVSHVTPTPVGMSVTAEIELIAVEERSLLFKVSCCDETGLIGEGTHRRAIIDLNRFTRRLADKPSRSDS